MSEGWSAIPKEMSELTLWLQTMDKVYMTSRCLHGTDWANSRVRHKMISDDLAGRLSFIFSYGKTLPTAEVLAKIASNGVVGLSNEVAA